MSLFKRLSDVLHSPNLKVKSSHFVLDDISMDSIRGYIAKKVIGRFTEFGNPSTAEMFANGYLHEYDGKINLRLRDLLFHTLQCPKCGNSHWSYFSVNEKTCTVTIEAEKPCPIKRSEISVSRKIVTDGILEFINFLENGPKMDYSTSDISYYAGTKNFSKQHAKQNLGYVQTGGYTSVAVYRNKQGTEIVVADPTDVRKLRKKEMEGFRLVGEIDCNVWSFIIKDSKDEKFQKSARDLNETVSVKVKPGTYEIVSHFVQRMDNPIWATIKLVKKP